MSHLGSEAAAPFTADEIAGFRIDPSTEGKCIHPVSADAGIPDFKLPGRGEPDHRYPYRDSTGAVLGFVLRWNARDDLEKEFRPATYWANGNGKPSWRLKAWPGRRPLFGLDQLAAHPDAIVLLTEGEKAAEAVERGPLGHALKWAKQSVIGMTWPGGTNAIRYADFSPLAGREIVILPDNDEAGENAADQLVTALHEVGVRRLRRWKAPRNAKTKWDIADPLPEDATPDAMVESLNRARNRSAAHRQNAFRISR